MTQCDCSAIAGGEHYVSCPMYEPPLTPEELRRLRATVLSVEPLPQRISRNWDGSLA